MVSLSPAEWLVLAVAFAALTIVLQHSRTRKRLPPGPPGLPFLGNMFQMPKAARHRKFTGWAKQYGEIYHLKVGPQSIVVLNSSEAADELLSKRAKNYSNRPAAHVAYDLISDRQRMVLMPYNEQWKVARKNVASAIGSASMKHIRNLQELESRVLLKDLMDYGDKDIRVCHTPREGPASYVPEDHWFFLIRRFATSIILSITYAERIHKLHDNAHVTKVYDIMTNFLRAMQPGRYAADVFSFLRLLPDVFAKWRIEGKKMHEWEMELFGGLLEQHKSNVKGGMSRDCFMSSYLRARADSGHEDAPGVGITPDGWMRDKFLTYTAGSMLEAGSDTTASTLQIFLLYMFSFPDVFNKAREEIDEVVGSERMPTWEDEERLPYLVACIKEVMRIRPSATGAIPHAALEDDEYKGYFIPKGSIILGNVWAMHRDPEKYPDPETFRPERFYKPGEPTHWNSGPEPKGRDNYIFGWGRRFCQGSHVAEASLFIACARIVWGLDMIPPVDENNGRWIVPDIDDEDRTWSNETLNAPKIFPVIWRARDSKRAELVGKSVEEAQREWDVLGLEPDVR